MRSPRHLMRCRPSSLVALALAAAILVPMPAATAATTSPAGGPAPCADIMPLGEVEAGMVGTGWTVVRGDTPRPFRARILGVIEDWVAPGRDIIVVEVSDLPGRRVIAAGDGIWAGMSGSPVYVGDLLVDAIAYSFTDGPSRIGWVTPAQDMARLLAYPDPTAGGAGSPRSTRQAHSGAQLRSLMRLAGVDRAEAATFERLPLPFMVSGVPARGRAMLEERLDAAGVPAVVTAGPSAPAPSAGSTFATPVPGGGFAALISYGDVTWGAAGTVTWVRGERALAFCHPLALVGPAGFGANAAPSLAIVQGGTGRSFRLSGIGAPYGVVDQDRLAGLRARLGVAPARYRVFARVTDTDLGVTRTGRTSVTMQDWIWYVAPQHMYANMISTTDREGPGTARVRFAIEGRRANGDPWSLVVSDRLASDDIQLEVAMRIDGLLGVLINNGFEAVTLTRIEARATVEEEVKTAEVRFVAISRNGGEYRVRDELRVQPGDQLDLRVRLRRFDGSRLVVPMHLVVPEGAQGSGELTVAPARWWEGGCEDPEGGCGPRSFPGLLRALRSGPRSDELEALLTFWGEEEPGVSVGTRVRLDMVVDGYISVPVSTR